VPLYKGRAPIRVIAPPPLHMHAALAACRVEYGVASRELDQAQPD